MTVKSYLSHRYKPIPAKSAAEAVAYFEAKYGYVPAPVRGPAGCTDAEPSNYVPDGYYLCAIREEGR